MSEQNEKREFDGFADNYADLIRDPVRERFAASDRFFAERKLQIIRSFCDSFGKGMLDLDWLDVGCGQGELLRLGQSYFRKASGCDPSAGMLSSCSDLDVRRQASVDLLPFESEGFDFITLVCVYHHVPLDRRLALTQEVQRLLRPHGILCVIEHNPWNPVTKLIVSRTPVDADARLLSVRRTQKLLTSAGFVTLGKRFFLFLPERFHRRFPTVEDRLHAVPVGGQYALFVKKKGHSKRHEVV